MDDAEFEQLFEAAAASGEETPAEEVEPEVTEAVVETETVEEVEEPEVEAPETPSYPEPVQKYLEKYQGDIAKALEAAAHAASKIGEQGQELGELRQLVEQLANRPEPRAPQTPFIPEQVQNAILENPGSVAQWALQNENPTVYEAAVREWYDQEPMAASRFEMQNAIQGVASTLAEQIAPEIKTVRETQQSRQVADAHASLARRYPDFNEVLGSASADEVAGIDRNLLESAMQQNPESALEYVYRWVASGRSQRNAAEREQRTEQVREEKRQAHVVSAEQTVEQTEPTAAERLKEFMLTPEAQSVSHGLTR